MHDQLEPYILPSLGDRSGHITDLKSWVSSNRFSNVSREGSVWRMEAYSPTELYKSFTTDYERFSFSSFETFSVSGAERVGANSTSWPMLKLYYAAFFSAHAITRATGGGYLHADSTISSSINKFLHTVDRKQEFKGGTYEISVAEDAKDASLLLKRASGSSGVHEGFWSYFTKHMSNLSEDSIEQTLPYAQDFFRKTTRLSDCIVNSDEKGVWFSRFRNSLNYSHTYDCWMPNSRKSPSRKLKFPKIAALQSEDESLLKERDNDLVRAIDLSTYLTGISFNVSELVSSNIGGNAAYSRRWKKLKNHFEAAP